MSYDKPKTSHIEHESSHFSCLGCGNKRAEMSLFGDGHTETYCGVCGLSSNDAGAKLNPDVQPLVGGGYGTYVYTYENGHVEKGALAFPASFDDHLKEARRRLKDTEANRLASIAFTHPHVVNETQWMETTISSGGYRTRPAPMQAEKESSLEERLKKMEKKEEDPPF